MDWFLWIEERVTANSTFNAGNIQADIGPSSSPAGWWSGTFSLDFRPGGLQSILIASGRNRVAHRDDGTGFVTVFGRIGSTGTSGAGGPTTISNSLTLSTLRLLPGVPSNVVPTRVSDTQVRVSWGNSGASNGQPTQNQIQASTPGFPGDGIITINASNQTTMAILPNEEKTYHVRAGNSAGWSAWSPWSPRVYTTPGTPSGVAATKSANLDITVSFKENVSYAEHNHEVWHGTVLNGVTTWDPAPLATLASGVQSYVHVAPDTSKIHNYRVRSKQGTLYSPFVESNSVQILVAPNAPIIRAMPSTVDRAASLTLTWVHNTVDTTPQSAYEFSYSINGGQTWTSTGKVLSTVSAYSVPANTYPANTILSTRVRTWGAATTGGAEGTGESPWSATSSVTFKTRPVLYISSPANGSTLNDATIRATLGFSQAQGAAYVKASIQLLQGSTLLEELDTNILVGVTMATPAANTESYTLRARGQDSNGIWSDWVSNTFSVAYLPPVTPTLDLSYIADKGFGQVNIFIPEPSSGEDEAATISVSRTIDGLTEILVSEMVVPLAPQQRNEISVGDVVLGPGLSLGQITVEAPVSSLGILDTTPTVHGTNTYTVTVTSPLGAQTTVSADLVTTECRRAFLSKGAGFSLVVVFGGNLSVDESLSVASTTVEAAGRLKPIGLYGMETSVQLKVESFVYGAFGSPISELRSMLLTPGQACYRDPSGRRVFGSVKGSISYQKVDQGSLSFTLTETS